jgi:hypothetical protein
MTPEYYSLEDVICVAKIHPFYAAGVQYPPSCETIQAAREAAANGPAKADLASQPIIGKNDLYAFSNSSVAVPNLIMSSYNTIERLVKDASPQNTYRHGVYASITGGGFGSTPLFFATDVHENRRQRAYFGRFIRTMGLIEHGDWVLTTHCAGELYRYGVCKWKEKS